MISIVIPLFNKQNTILKTIDSVLSQVFSDFEIVIINDGSTDNSEKVVSDNIKDQRVRLINKSNSGVSATRNLGIKEAKGEWVLFLDADDTLCSDALANFSSYISLPNVDIITTDFYILSRDERKCYVNEKVPKYIKNNYRSYCNREFFIRTGNTLIKKGLLKSCAFDCHYSRNEDLEWAYRLMSDAKIYYAPFCSMNYEIDDAEASKIKNHEKDYCFKINLSGLKYWEGIAKGMLIVEGITSYKKQWQVLLSRYIKYWYYLVPSFIMYFINLLKYKLAPRK